MKHFHASTLLFLLAAMPLAAAADDCKVKIKEKHGHYQEEIKCKGGVRPAPVVVRSAVVVRPAPVVVQPAVVVPPPAVVVRPAVIVPQPVVVRPAVVTPGITIRVN